MSKPLSVVQPRPPITSPETAILDEEELNLFHGALEALYGTLLGLYGGEDLPPDNEVLKRVDWAEIADFVGVLRFKVREGVFERLDRAVSECVAERVSGNLPARQTAEAR